MSQEEKQLLLKDLCARLPYDVIGLYSWKGNEPYNRELTGSLFDELKSSWNSTEDSEFVPYLRPMSSMTDEERAERIELLWELEGHINEDVTYKYQDWLNKHHFDYRGLIPMGLAIAVTEENNPYE